MDSDDTREPAAGGSLSDQRRATYRRVMEAEDRLDHVRRRRGLPESTIAEVLEEVEGAGPDVEPAEDVYLRTVIGYVSELGGYVEVRAVFADATVTLLREPPPAER